MWQFRLSMAAQHLRRGGIVAYPTEAVYGLGCDPLNPSAVERLFELKNRPVVKALILIAADLDQINDWVRMPGDATVAARLQTSWPGPTTWVLPVAPGVPAWLRGDRETLAVRVTAHPVASALCRLFGGPIVSTSANRSGLRPARTRVRLFHQFGAARLPVVPGALGGAERPTPIFDAVSGRQLRV